MDLVGFLAVHEFQWPSRTRFKSINFLALPLAFFTVLTSQLATYTCVLPSSVSSPPPLQFHPSELSHAPGPKYPQYHELTGLVDLFQRDIICLFAILLKRPPSLVPYIQCLFSHLCLFLAGPYTNYILNACILPIYYYT